MEFEAGEEGSGVKEGEDETEGDGGGEAERGRLGMGSEGSGVGAKVTLVGSCPFLVSFYCRAFPTVIFLTLSLASTCSTRKPLPFRLPSLLYKSKQNPWA